MTVYAIAQSRVTDRPQLEAYVKAASPTLAEHGGRVLALDETPIAVEGDVDYPRTVIVAFESETAFYRWYDSPGYRAARELRKDAAVGRFILVQGLPGD